MALMRLQMNPDVITCYVKTGETVTAGNLVKADASSDDVVTSSGASTFIPDDLQISDMDGASDYPYCIGIAGTDGAALAIVPVFTRGLFILLGTEAITAGAAVQGSESASEEAQVQVCDAGAGEHRIGKALTGCSDGGYLVVLLNI